LASWVLCSCTGADAAAPEGAASAAAAPPALAKQWAPFVRVDTLEAVQNESWLTVAGRLGYDEDTTQQVRPPVNGRITKVWVRLGEAVTTGQPLVSLVSSEAAQLKAELQKDAQDVEVLGRARERSRSLLRDGAVSPREVAEADAAYNKAVAEQDRDRAHVAALGLQLDTPGAEAVLVAHKGGVVTAREAVVGQELRADASEPLMVVSDLDRLWLWASVYERDLSGVAVGAKVSARVAAWPEQPFDGQVDYVGDVLDAETHTVRVRGTLDNRARKLKPRMFATVQIAQPQTGRLWLDCDAVVLRGERTFAVVVGERDALSLREVALGAIVDGRQPVLRGLVAGERVVAKGAVLVAQQLSRPR
jgi:cobalt-zinc-cadmium efflux system membrane fusion protein